MDYFSKILGILVVPAARSVGFVPDSCLHMGVGSSTSTETATWVLVRAPSGTRMCHLAPL